MVANFPIQIWQKQTRMQTVHLFPHIVSVLVLNELGHVLQQEAVHLAAAACSASKRSIRRFVITEKAPTRAFSWLKAATTAFTFKTLLRHYAKRALTSRSLNVKLGPRHNYHEGRAAIRHYANQPTVPYDFCVADPISCWETVGSTPV